MGVDVTQGWIWQQSLRMWGPRGGTSQAPAALCAGRFGQKLLPTLVSGKYPSVAHRSLDCSTGTRATWGPYAAGRGTWPARGRKVSP